MYKIYRFKKEFNYNNKLKKAILFIEYDPDEGEIYNIGFCIDGSQKPTYTKIKKWYYGYQSPLQKNIIRPNGEAGIACTGDALDLKPLKFAMNTLMEFIANELKSSTKDTLRVNLGWADQKRGNAYLMMLRHQKKLMLENISIDEEARCCIFDASLPPIKIPGITLGKKRGFSYQEIFGYGSDFLNSEYQFYFGVKDLLKSNTNKYFKAILSQKDNKVFDFIEIP